MNASQKKLWSYIKSKKRITVVFHHYLKMAQCIKTHLKRQKFSIAILYLFSDKKSTPPTLAESPISDITPINIEMHGVKNLLDSLDPYKATSPEI